MWTADPNPNQKLYDTILAWLPEKTRENILERADLYVWWQINHLNIKLSKETRNIIKHAYIVSASQTLSDDMEQ